MMTKIKAIGGRVLCFVGAHVGEMVIRTEAVRTTPDGCYSAVRQLDPHKKAIVRKTRIDQVAVEWLECSTCKREIT